MTFVMGLRLRAVAGATSRTSFVICAVTPQAEALHMNPIAMFYQSKQLIFAAGFHSTSETKNGSYERP
jgi:hypothetical protein